MSALEKVVALVAASILLCAVATPLAAQGFCTDCMDLVGEVKHVAPSSHEIIIGWYGPAHMLPSGGSCLFSHLAGCSNYGEEEHLALIEALDSGDSQRVVRLSALVGGRVRLNLERRSFQVMACDGISVLANVPLDEGQFKPLVGSVLLP